MQEPSTPTLSKPTLSNREAQVATVLGWKCCCDVELDSVSSQEWKGIGFSRKNQGVVRFQFHLSVAQESPVLKLQLQENGNTLDLEIPAAESSGGSQNIVFHFDVGTFFGEAESKDGIGRNRLAIIIGGNASLKRTFLNYAFGLSYMPVVLDLFTEKQAPLRILEWGLGRSSIFFAELFPEAKITGVEHHSRWFENCEKITRALPNVSMNYRHLKLAPAQSEGYVSFPLESGVMESRQHFLTQAPIT